MATSDMAEHVLKINNALLIKKKIKKQQVHHEINFAN